MMNEVIHMNFKWPFTPRKLIDFLIFGRISLIWLSACSKSGAIQITNWSNLCLSCHFDMTFSHSNCFFKSQIPLAYNNNERVTNDHCSTSYQPNRLSITHIFFYHLVVMSFISRISTSHFHVYTLKNQYYIFIYLYIYIYIMSYTRHTRYASIFHFENWC